jgi:multidrug resistance efflux pump
MAKATSRRMFWVLGILLLVGSAAGAGWMFRQPSAGAQEGTKASSSAADPDAPVGIIAQGYVDVRDGVRRLYPPQPGRVVWVAEEGKACAKDDVVLQVDDEVPKLDADQARAALRDAESKYEQAKILPQQHADKVEAQKAVIDGAEDSVNVLDKTQDTRRRLKKLGTTILQSEFDVGEAALSVAKAKVRAEKAKLNELQRYDPKLGVDVARANVDAKKAQLAKAEKVVDECKVRAPAKGTVLRVQAAAGELAGPQSPFIPVQFCPDEERLVRAEVLQDWASKVKVGQECEIRDDAISGKRWKGKVTQVSDWFTHRRSIVQEPFQLNDVSTLECLVSVEGGTQGGLRIGQRLRVTIKQGGP